MKLLQGAMLHRWPKPAQRGDVLIDETIRQIAPRIEPDDEWLVVDLDGYHLSPGFIDLQINGGFGNDLTSNPDSLRDLAAKLPRHGVTAFLPTVITSPRAQVEAATRTMLTSTQHAQGAIPLGLHLEGPFLTAARHGAHDPDHLMIPNEAMIAGWSRDAGVRLVTLAPELPGSLHAITALADRGVVVAAGHSNATFDETGLAADAGLTLVTHLFNAMGPLHHREPGIVGRTFTDSRLTASIIVDGHHVHPAVVRTAWQMLGPDRMVLITDAMAGLGQGDGPFLLANTPVSVTDGRALTRDGSLAGSVLSLDQAVRNLTAITGCAPSEALAAASTTPTRVLGEASRGRLAKGMRADIVVLDSSLEVQATLIGGDIAHLHQQCDVFKGLPWKW